jgi:hypothetical protein
MGAELPHIPGGSDVVLYPASARASGELQESLEASGFKVGDMGGRLHACMRSRLCVHACM